MDNLARNFPNVTVNVSVYSYSPSSVDPLDTIETELLRMLRSVEQLRRLRESGDE
jgi:hypothetical protein